MRAGDRVLVGLAAVVVAATTLTITYQRLDRRSGVFYCEKTPAPPNTLRMCARSCSRGECFSRSTAYCYQRSMVGLDGWRSEVMSVCFPTAEECDSDQSSAGTGTAGPPPVKTECRVTMADEVESM